MTKICTKCKAEKPLVDFKQDDTVYKTKGYFSPRCRVCEENIANGLKRCSSCEEWKATSSFYNSKRTKDGFSVRCKDCSTESYKKSYAKPEVKARHSEYAKQPHVREKGRIYSSKPEVKARGFSRMCLKKYGVTGEQVEALILRQRGHCAICDSVPDKNITGNTGRLHVDHDHKTGKVRGMLCYACNLALGGFKDSPYILERAAGYLKTGGVV